MPLKREWVHHASLLASLGALAVITWQQSVLAISWAPFLEAIILAGLQGGQYVLYGSIGDVDDQWHTLLARPARSVARSGLVWSCTQLPFGAAMALHLMNLPLEVLVEDVSGAQAAIAAGGRSGPRLLAMSEAALAGMALLSAGRLNQRSLLYGLVALASSALASVLDTLASRHTRPDASPRKPLPLLSTAHAIPLASILGALGTSIALNRLGLHPDRAERRDIVMGVAYGVTAAVAAATAARIGAAMGEHAEVPQLDGGVVDEAPVHLRRQERMAFAGAVLAETTGMALFVRLTNGSLGYFGWPSAMTALAALAILAVEHGWAKVEEKQGYDEGSLGGGVVPPFISQYAGPALLGLLSLEVATVSWTQSPWNIARPSWDTLSPSSAPSGRTATPSAEIILAHYNEPVEVVRHTVQALRGAVSAFPNARVTIYSKGFEDFHTASARSNITEAAWAMQRESELDAVRSTGADRVITLPNFGREGATYLDYIIEHYDNLPHTMVFSQVDPDFAWVYWDRLKLVNPDVGFVSLGQYLSLHDGVDSRGNGHYPQVEVVWKLFHDQERDPYRADADILASYGGQFVVSRRRVHQNPRSAYEKLKRILVSRPGDPDHVGGFAYKNQAEGSVNPFFGHVLERSWCLIFNASDSGPARACKEGDGSDRYSVFYDLPLGTSQA